MLRQDGNDGEPVSTEKRQPRQFFGALESLRGVAALSVALYHVSWLSPFHGLGIVRNGYLMVDFFFVLSGFVVAHSYGKKIAAPRDLARFMWLRVGRLYPLHLAITLVFLGVQSLELVNEWIVGDPGELPFLSHFSPTLAVSNLLLLHGLVHPGGILNGPSWSISTEIFAYLTFAVTLLLCRTEARLGVASIAIVAASIAILGSVGRLASLNITTDYSFFRCTAGFSTGVVTYLVFTRTRETAVRLAAVVPPAAAVGATLLALVVFLSLKSLGRSDFWMIPAVAFAIWLVASAPTNRACDALQTPFLSWLGKVSYSIYMVHFGIVWIFAEALEALGTPARAVPGRDAVLDPGTWVGALCVVLFVAAVLGVSQLTFHWIEEPFRRRSRELAARWSARESKGSPGPKPLEVETTR